MKITILSIDAWADGSPANDLVAGFTPFQLRRTLGAGLRYYVPAIGPTFIWMGSGMMTAHQRDRWEMKAGGL